MTPTHHPALDSFSEEQLQGFDKDFIGLFTSSENDDLSLGILSQPTAKGWMAIYNLSRTKTFRKDNGNFPCLYWNKNLQALCKIYPFSLINFDGQLFKKAYFSNYDFPLPVSFDNAIIEDVAYFDNTQFSHEVTFMNAQFKGGVHFNKLLGKYILFNDAVFSDRSFFQNITIENLCSFTNTRFENDVFFGDLKLSNKTSFGNSCFMKSVQFSKVVFDEVDFSNTVFHNKTIFEDCIFNRKTQFNKAKFNLAPVFHGSTLHQDTSFHDAIFPLDESTKNIQGEGAMRAYRTLKVFFSKFDALREEQRFFRFELIEETELQTSLKKYLYKAYACFSNYGLSIRAPLGWLIGLPALVILIFGLALCYRQGWIFAPSQMDFIHTKQFLSIIVNNALPLVSDSKLDDKITLELFGAKGGVIMYGYGIIQKFFALIGWFLVGLAVRNRFKMR